MALELVAVAALLGASFFAGLLGALVGIGGGVLLIPFLVLCQNVPMHYAIGASIVGVVATSSASASAYVRSRLSNIRLGMLLETGTSVGALAGAFVSLLLPVSALETLFALVALYVCASMLFSAGREEKGAHSKQDWLGSRLRLHSSYWVGKKEHRYFVQATPLGIAGSFVAGVLSGLFGIGGGIIKVPLMHIGMKVPMRAAAATSNFMIGVTAATGAAVFASRGYVLAELAAPVAIGVTAGSLLGSGISHRVGVRSLKLIFAAILLYTAVRMLLHGIGVQIGF